MARSDSSQDLQTFFVVLGIHHTDACAQEQAVGKAAPCYHCTEHCGFNNHSALVTKAMSNFNRPPTKCYYQSGDSNYKAIEEHSEIKGKTELRADRKQKGNSMWKQNTNSCPQIWPSCRHSATQRQVVLKHETFQTMQLFLRTSTILQRINQNYKPDLLLVLWKVVSMGCQICISVFTYWCYTHHLSQKRPDQNI